jgi:hypothetical protein
VLTKQRRCVPTKVQRSPPERVHTYLVYRAMSLTSLFALVIEEMECRWALAWSPRHPAAGLGTNRHPGNGNRIGSVCSSDGRQVTSGGIFDSLLPRDC